MGLSPFLDGQDCPSYWCHFVIDFEVQRCTRRCHATDRELQPGEVVYSALVKSGSQVVRRDWAESAWSGPTGEMVSWWRTKLPEPAAKRAAMAPGEVMLELFESLEGLSDQADFRYVLALLLVRRRVLKLEGSQADADASGVLRLYSTKTDQRWQVPIVMPSKSRTAAIQAEIGRLLFTGSTPKPSNDQQGSQS